ncbi:hypothetical protein DICA2_F37456 [Diutina catenulata]
MWFLVIVIALCVCSGVSALAQFCQARHGWGLKYPRRGKFGTYYYELHKRTPNTSMADVQDALDRVLPEVVFEKQVFANPTLLERVSPKVYYGELWVDGVWQGTLRVSKAKYVSKSVPDSPLDRLEYTTEAAEGTSAEPSVPSVPSAPQTYPPAESTPQTYPPTDGKDLPPQYEV